MAKRYPNWNVTCKRFVAFLDIIGFKDMVLRKSHKEVQNTLISFNPTIKSVRETAEKQSGIRKIVPIIEDGDPSNSSVIFPVSFSDSILLISSDDSYICARNMIVNISLFLLRAICNRIPMKGAIAYGEFTADLDESLYFGKPLIDAFELQNELKLYGVILHNTMEKYLANKYTTNFFEKNGVHRWSVPMKSGNITHYIVDWTWIDRMLDDAIEWVSNLYEEVSGNPRQYVDNTLDFLRWLKAKETKQRQQKTP